MLWTTNITRNMLHIDMKFKFIIIKEVYLTEITIRMQKDNVSKFINVSSIHVFVQLVKSI
jgi:hypothetical protein